MSRPRSGGDSEVDAAEVAPTLPWWPEPRGGALDLDEIARVATDLIDEGGVAHLTMRRLAEALDVAPMGLYWYVANRDELLTVVRDAAFAAVLDALVTDAGWNATLRSVALALRSEVVVGHPNLLPVVASSEYLPGPNVLTMIDRVLGVLRAEGFSSYDATWAFQMISSLALDRPADAGDLEMLVGEGLESFPALTAVMNDFADQDPGGLGRSALFETTIDAALAGIGAMIDRREPTAR